MTTRSELLDDLCVLLGRLAEQLIIGEISTGAYDNLQRANAIARSMVEELGMSEKLGLATFVHVEVGVASLGGERRALAEVTAQLDQELQTLNETQKLHAEALTKEHREGLERLAEYLIEHGRCDLEQLTQLLEKSA